MIGIKEIIEKLAMNKPLTEEEKFKYLQSKKVPSQVIDYLVTRLNNLFIEVLDEYDDKLYQGKIFELMPTKKLERWCWETTESAIVFLNDNDYIERGNLRFDKETPQYSHSWIVFHFEGKEYVFDPVLNLICTKEDYSKIFEINIKARVRAKKVKAELIKQLTDKPKEENSKNNERLMRLILGDSYETYRNQKKEEINIHGPEDINAPLYRMSAGMKHEIDDGIIKKLRVHYYKVEG